MVILGLPLGIIKSDTPAVPVLKILIIKPKSFPTVADSVTVATRLEVV